MPVLKSNLPLPTTNSDAIRQRAERVLELQHLRIYQRADRLFATIMLLQFVAAIALAAWISPRTWSGLESEVHPHIWAAIFLGGMVTCFPVWMAFHSSGTALTRHTIAVGQMLMSALLIHLTGGRIETHFHVFGSLAFLAFYRDWRVLITASVVVGLDHFIRGIYWPESVYGVFTETKWRWLEHAGWVGFEVTFLCISIRQSTLEMGGLAMRQAELEVANAQLESEVEERRIAESTVREQAALLDKARDAIMVFDSDQRIVYWNNSAERMYGWSASEVLGKRAAELFSKDTTEALSEIHNLVQQHGEWTGELRQFTREQKEIIVESRKTLVRDETGRPKSILAINTDVTEKKQLEAQFLRAQRMEGIGTLAGGIAHDLNNVFAPIMMSINILEEKLQDKEGRDLLETIESSAQRGAGMVKQVLSFSRGVHGRRTTVPLQPLLHEITKIARETFPRSIVIEKNADATLWAVNGDATHLYQVLMNLCVNARDAMPEGGTLKISAENIFLDETRATIHEVKAGQYVLITVSDTGTGIPEEIINKIFEPFFTTKDVGKGTGLGLSTVIGIVKSHGGNVTVLSKMGKGSTFKVYLPAVMATGSDTQLPDRKLPPSGNGELILVVDDELAVRRLTETILKRYGYSVVGAANGVEALGIFSQRKAEIKAVITDVMMPEMDGIAMVRALRRLDPDLKIIAASGLVTDEQMDTLNKGNVPFVNKPFIPDVLLRLLNQALSSDDKARNTQQVAPLN